jgi:hypothetical protein
MMSNPATQHRTIAPRHHRAGCSTTARGSMAIAAAMGEIASDEPRYTWHSHVHTSIA